jgi:predicted deacetylase
MQALVSIHDLMPHTMERVERILDWLKERSVPPVTLLVVPGRPWQPGQIERLRELAALGHQLAAHGWHHETTPRRLYHRIHATLISRNVAEHLDLDSRGILELMQRSNNWFVENDLPAPDFYVPPAWALGPINQTDLAEVPFQLIETTRGLIYPARKAGPENKDSRFQKLPLTGYEADTALREFFLRRWNAAQAKTARRKNLPLRISIHPDDLDLRIADQIGQQIKDVEAFLPYSGKASRV